MKNVAALFCAAFCCLSVSAQQPAASPSTPVRRATAAQDEAAAARQSNSRAIPVPSTANAPEVGNPQLRPVAGELETKLDSRTARSGESVVVRTTQSAATADGIVIPKGSKILGHVTSVEASDQANENARVTLQFDRAELKGGQKLPIKSVIQSVAPASAGNQSAGSSASSASPDSAKVAAPTSSESGSVAHSTAGSAPGSSGGPVGTVVAKNGNVDIRTTAIPGVLLAADADGQPFSNASGALVGSRKNVHLDGGTKLVLAVADVPLRNSR